MKYFKKIDNINADIMTQITTPQTSSKMELKHCVIRQWDFLRKASSCWVGENTGRETTCHSFTPECARFAT